MGAIHGVMEFHVLRVLLGIAEAGFFRGIILYLSFWFPNADRGRAIGALAVGLPAANLLGAPLSSWILRHNWFDIAGWRWLFVLEGLPSVVAGVLTLLYLADGPGQASWPSPQERETLERVKASQSAPMRTPDRPGIRGKADYILPLLILVWFLDNMGVYGFNLWLPSMLHRASGYSSATVVAISSLPFAGAAIAAAFVSLSTDRTGERRWHTAIPSSRLEWAWQ
ncbi:MAG: MFS transporter [Bryobacteraceae bacterium]